MKKILTRALGALIKYLLYDFQLVLWIDERRLYKGRLGTVQSKVVALFIMFSILVCILDEYPF